MSVRKSYGSWRQKGIAGVISGLLTLPFIDGYVQEHIPQGMLGHLRQPPSVEQREDPFPTPHISQAERTAGETLESIISSSHASSSELSPELSFKAVTSLAHLTRDDIEAYERAGAVMGVPPAMLATISILESEGGRILTPFGYATDDPNAPRGHHHVKPGSLHSVLEQAGEARSYFERQFGERWPDIAQNRWRTIRDYDTLLTKEERERFEGAFVGSPGARRMLSLASIIPDDFESLDLEDAYESALAAGTMITYMAAYLSSHGFDVDAASLLLAYTAGQDHARNVFAEDFSEPFIEKVRSSVGPHSAWYVKEGSSLIEHLSSYSSLQDARDHALRIVDLAQRAPEANDETLGLLYVMIHKNPELYDWIAQQLEPTENGRRDINRVAAQQASSFFAPR